MHLPRFMQQVPAVLDHRPNIEACGFTNGWVLYSYVQGITREPACEKKQAMYYDYGRNCEVNRGVALVGLE